jgi:protein-tyrosine kinase
MRMRIPKLWRRGADRQAAPARDRLLALADPTSVHLEAYRRLYRQISRLRAEQNVQSIGITSADVAEGKTLTSINLALTMAEDTRNRVVLVDCDFRLPRVASYLGITSPKGLSDVVFGKASLGEIMVSLDPPHDNLAVIPQRRLETAKGEDILSVFYENRLAPILAELRTGFDYIVVDTPPILPVADQEYIAEMVDAMLLVVRAGKTSRDRVRAALDSSKSNKIVGIVFNDTIRQWSSPYSSVYSYNRSYDRYRTGGP